MKVYVGTHVFYKYKLHNTKSIKNQNTQLHAYLERKNTHLSVADAPQLLACSQQN